MKESAVDEAKAFLGEAERLQMEIWNIELEIEKWRGRATSTTASMGGERVQTSGNPHKMENAICIIVDLEKEMAEQIKKKWDAVKEIKSVIRQLPLREHDILYKRYIVGMRWDEIAVACNMSSSNCTTIHGRALVNVQNILNEREKNMRGQEM